MNSKGNSNTEMGEQYAAVVGTFDGLHLGHNYLIERLKHTAELKGLRPMVITFTNHPLEVIAPERAPKALMSANDKLRLLRAKEVKVIMLPFDEKLRQTSTDDFLAYLSHELGVKLLIMGFNNRLGHDAPNSLEQYCQSAAKAGMALSLCDEYSHRETPKVSSSEIRQLLTDGNVEEAGRLLGRPYSLSGIVVHGHRIGRTIGFPTANLQPVTPNQLIPKPGVYAAYAIIGDRRLRAMVNIGSRPTFADASIAPITIEAHLIDCNEDLYGQTLTLQFMHRLRDERHFANPATLAAQIAADRSATMALLG